MINLSLTDNSIELLVKLGVDTAPSENNLQAQINALAKKLEANVEIKFNDESLNSSNRKIKVTGESFTALSKAARETSDNVAKLYEALKKTGQDSSKPLNQIKKNFDEIKGTLNTLYKDFPDESKRILTQGTADAEKLKQAFKGLQPVFNEVTETITDSAGKQTKVLKALAITYTNMATKARDTMTFNNRSLIDMGNGTSKNLWLPDAEIKSINSSVKEVEARIIKFQDELFKLRNAGKITTEQFKNFSLALNEMHTPSGLRLYGRALDEAVQKTKQENIELATQRQLKNKLIDTENELIRIQSKNPKLRLNPETSAIQQQIKNLQSASVLASQDVTDLTQRLSRFKAETTAVGRESMSLVDSFKTAMEKFPLWMASSTIFFGTVQSIKDSISQIIDLDSQLVVLKRVTNGTIDTNDALKESVRLAGELGNLISEVNEGMISFARQGYRGDDLLRLTEYATLLGNISELSVDEASSTLTAVMKGFNVEAQKSIHIVDAMNEVN